MDSVSHILQCCEMGPVPERPEELVGFLVGLAEKACAPTPGLPIPCRPLTALEIELDLDMDTDAEGREGIRESDLSPAEISFSCNEEGSDD